MMPEVLIHIGLPKTATSFLQLVYFRKLHDQGIINLIYLNNDKGLIKKLCADDFLDFNPANYPFELAENKLNIISYEGFVGLSKQKNITAYINALKLKKLFPEATLLLLIRNQKDQLLSLYKQAIHEGATFKPYKYLSYRKGKITPGLLLDDLTLNLDFYKYSRIIKSYENLFQKKFKVVLFERMWSKDEGIPNIMAEINSDLENIKFDNKKKNVGYGYHQLKLARILNRFIPSKYNMHGLYIPIGGRHPFFRNWLQNSKLSKMWNKPFLFNPEIERAIEKYYKEDNQRLKELGINITREYKC